MLKNKKITSERWKTWLLLLCGSTGGNCAAADDDPAITDIGATLTGVYQYGFYEQASDENGETLNDKGRTVSLWTCKLKSDPAEGIHGMHWQVSRGETA